jgi:predicted AAA+ superfamily ATPase
VRENGSEWCGKPGFEVLTAVTYDAVLELLYATERIPAWHSNRLKRLTRSPKRYVSDSAIAVVLAGANLQGVLRDGNLLGRLIDTFVLGQLRPELPLGDYPPVLHHLRTDEGRHEYDLIAEHPDGRIAAIEVKAAGAARPDDARHLVWLRDHLGDQFAAGIVFHTGPRPYALGDRITALPISSIWRR